MKRKTNPTQSSINDRLVKTIEASDNQNEIKRLRSEGASYDLVSNNGDTLLHLAVAYNRIETVKLLIDEGIDLNSKNKNNNTPLMIAVINGYSEVVKALIDAGAEKDTLTSLGFKDLYLSDEDWHFNVAKYLIESGADINDNEDYQTALHLAAKQGHFKVVKYLVENGADIDILGYEEELDNCNHMITYFIYSYTALTLAAYSGDLEIVKYLVDEKKADVNDKEDSSDKPLFGAIVSGKLEVVKYLVEKGANINALNEDDSGHLALHVAAENGYLDIIKYLIEEVGLDKNAVDKDGNTALHQAAKGGYLETVKYLVEKELNLEAVDADGNTALHIAAEYGNLEALQYLVERGLNIGNLNNYGQSALHLAASSFHSDLATLKYLIEEVGLDKNAVDHNGRTALHLAAKYGNSETVKYLVEKELNIEAVDADGNTALHLAVKEKNISNHLGIKALIESGADITAIDKDGFTALHFKSYYFSKKFLLPIFKKAIDEGNSGVLVNLCKYEHYKAQLSIIDPNDSPIDSSTVQEFINFLSKYKSIPEETAQDDVVISELSSSSVSNKRSLEEKEENSPSKHIKTEYLSETSKAAEGHSYSISLSLGRFLHEHSFVEDYHLPSHVSPLLKFLDAIMPKIKIEGTSKEYEPKLLKLNAAEEPKFEENGKAISYGEIFYKATMGLKALDMSVDVFKLYDEPTLDHLNMLVRDAAHFGVILTGTSGYLPLVSAVDIAVQAYNGEYSQAITQAGATVGYMLLPSMLGASIAPIYTAAALTYTGYKMATNVYTLYSNYETPESQLKSNLAYANLGSILGSEDMTKKCLLNAAKIVETYNADQSIQHIAAEYNLFGELCKLDTDYGYCDIF